MNKLLLEKVIQSCCRCFKNECHVHNIDAFLWMTFQRNVSSFSQHEYQNTHKWHDIVCVFSPYCFCSIIAKLSVLDDLLRYTQLKAGPPQGHIACTDNPVITYSVVYKHKVKSQWMLMHHPCSMTPWWYSGLSVPTFNCYNPPGWTRLQVIPHSQTVTYTLCGMYALRLLTAGTY